MTDGATSQFVGAARLCPFRQAASEERLDWRSLLPAKPGTGLQVHERSSSPLTLQNGERNFDR